jgi:hypothetical protein
MVSVTAHDPLEEPLGMERLFLAILRNLMESLKVCLCRVWFEDSESVIKPCPTMPKRKYVSGKRVDVIVVDKVTPNDRGALGRNRGLRQDI